MPYSKSVHNIRSAAVLTNSYEAATDFGMDRQDYLGVLVEITLGSLTSVEVKIETSVDGGVTFGQQSAESTSGGTITVDLAERTFDADGKYWIVVQPLLADVVRVSIKGTGTVTGSSAALTAITGTV